MEVYRLVAAGTIEEIVYARQIYKQQQANIGYNASSERRYFKGVQQDPNRKGEIFGMKNLFSFKGDQVVLQGIVNQTNVAEARVSAQVVDVDMDKIAEAHDLNHINVKKEDTGDDDGGLSQLAAYIQAEDPDQLVQKSKKSNAKADAVQAILQKAGVKYTHENSEVIGSSKVEAQLSRQAELAQPTDFNNPEGESALFAEIDTGDAFSDADIDAAFAPDFHPPEDVQIRHFCSMAKELGLSAMDFAFSVEQMTQEERRDALDAFYKRRMARLVEEEINKDREAEARDSDHHKGKHDANIKDEPLDGSFRAVPSDLGSSFERQREEKIDTAAPVMINKGPISSLFIDGDDDDEF